MNTKREARLNMFHSVIDLCENNLVIVALVVAFQTSYNIFKTTVTAIVAGMTELEAQTGGIGTSKKVSKKQVATMGSGIAGMVFAYATVINDEELKGAMDIPFSRINRALDDEVVTICNNIYEAANDNLANLGDYGVTAPLLATFQTAIDDYEAKKPKPKQSKNHKKAVNEQVKTMEKDAMKELKDKMDKLAVNFMSNGNGEFEAQYRAARVLVEPGSFSTVLKIQALNSVTKLPVIGAKCYRDDSPTFKLSTKLGRVTYKDIEQGAHSFVLKHKLFEDLPLTNVMISYGQKHEATALMIPKLSGNGGVTINREGEVPSPGIVNIDLIGIKGTPASMITIEVGGTGLRFYASATTTNPPGTTFYDQQPGSVTMSLSQFAQLVGFGPGLDKLNVQNIGMVQATYKLTFTNLEA